MNWTTLCTSETKADLEGEGGSYTLTSFLLPQASAAAHGHVSPEPLAPPVKKRTQRGQPTHQQDCGLLCGSPYSDSHSGDFRGICVVQSPRSWLWWRKREGLATTSIWILADGVPTCSAQVVVPVSSSAHLQNQVGGGLWPGNSAGYRSVWFGCSDEEFCWP